MRTAMWLPHEETKAHALAITAFVRERGAVYSAEILERFRISESTLPPSLRAYPSAAPIYPERGAHSCARVRR
jgi:hypothetical protein